MNDVGGFLEGEWCEFLDDKSESVIKKRIYKYDIFKNESVIVFDSSQSKSLESESNSETRSISPILRLKNFSIKLKNFFTWNQEQNQHQSSVSLNTINNTFEECIDETVYGPPYNNFLRRRHPRNQYFDYSNDDISNNDFNIIAEMQPLVARE